MRATRAINPLGWMVVLLAGGPILSELHAQEAPHPTHAHLGHVAEGWRDTPDGMGFLPTALAEAAIAAQHAAFAARNLEDLDNIQRHSAHVLHAIDPSRIAEGPGRGYGLQRAAEGVLAHLGMAMDHPEATTNLHNHGHHVVTSTENTLLRVARIRELTDAISAAGSASDAAPWVQELREVAEQLVTGVDRDGDGQVSWREGEGGLAQAEQHMEFLLRGEGLRGEDR